MPKSNNQKEVTISKEKCNKENLYATINLEAMEEASRNLRAGAYNLWTYFAKNQDQYHFQLSSKDVLNRFGIKKSQYDKAI